MTTINYNNIDMTNFNKISKLISSNIVGIIGSSYYNQYTIINSLKINNIISTPGVIINDFNDSILNINIIDKITD